METKTTIYKTMAVQKLWPRSAQLWAPSTVSSCHQLHYVQKQQLAAPTTQLLHFLCHQLWQACVPYRTRQGGKRHRWWADLPVFSSFALHVAVTYFYSMQHHEAASSQYKPHWGGGRWLHCLVSASQSVWHEKKCKTKKLVGKFWGSKDLERQQQLYFNSQWELPCCIKFQDTEALWFFSIFLTWLKYKNGQK